MQCVGERGGAGDGSDDSAKAVRCRKTTLGPTHGDPISYASVVPGAGYMLYATACKVIGLVKLPLDGNPCRCLGMIAHPGEITGCNAQRIVDADGPSRTKSACRSVRRALFMPQVNPGSRYHCGKRI